MIQNKQGMRVAGAAAIALAAAACGGGGGGGGGSPPPPPSAVTASATASSASVPEGQSFTLNASGSSTSNGQPLAYSWSQVSGPGVTIANPNNAQVTLSAAEVTSDTVAQFRVRVTAGADTAQAMANITFSNIAQTPTYNNGSIVLATATLSATPRVMLGSTQYGIVGVAEGQSDPLTFIEFSLPNGQLQVAPSQLPPLPQSARLELTQFFPQNAFGSNPPLIAAIEETGNRFRVFGRAFSGAISTVADFTLSAPCGVSNASVLSGQGLYVGQRNGYSIIYGGGASPNVVRSVSLGRPACVLLAPRFPISGIGGFLFPGPSPAFYDLITLDTTANTLSLYRADGPGGAAQYQEVAQAPVQLDSPASLAFVGWAEISANGPTSAMALVYSDGVFNGQHRLVIVGLDQARTLVQRTHAFSGAAPGHVFIDNLDVDSFYPEVVITSPGSPQAVIFEPTTIQVPGMAPLGAPQFFEIGLGSTAVIPKSAGVVSSSGPLNAMLAAYPDKKQIKAIAPAP